MGTSTGRRKRRKKGTLEVGTLGDMVVLDEDILTVDPQPIKDIKVLQAIIHGIVAYSATGAVTSR